MSISPVKDRIRPHVRVVNGLLTVLSLALVFGAVGGYVPDGAIPRLEPLVTVIPHLNVLVSLSAIGTISYGVWSIRQRNVDRHRAAMLASAALFGLFLLLYLYRVALEGPTSFEGPDAVRQFVYLPFLAIHILFAMVCLPFVYQALLLAGTHTVAELPETAHRRVGRVAASLWLVSFAMGIGVYLMLHVLF